MVLNSQYEGIAPLQRSKLLEESAQFAKIHAEAAQSGQSEPPSAYLEPPFAYTCFVQAPSSPDFPDDGKRLVELNGARDGPIDRGVCHNFLEDAAKYIKETFVDRTTDPKFNMLALSPPA